MKPYTGHHKYEAKFEATPERKTGISKLGKLIAKNANRSRKKADRQQARKEIIDALKNE